MYEKKLKYMVLDTSNYICHLDNHQNQDSNYLEIISLATRFTLVSGKHKKLFKNLSISTNILIQRSAKRCDASKTVTNRWSEQKLYHKTSHCNHVIVHLIPLNNSLLKSTPRAVPQKRCSSSMFIWLGDFSK